MAVLMGYYNVYFISMMCLIISFRFSRKILWLNVYPTNHDPKVVARHYLNCVEEVQGKKNFVQLSEW